jgi:subtilisin-like proprotein convertase family protein
MLQLVTDALKMTPINPRFTDARDALLQADCATNGCANEAWIWAGFADRGLGYNAKAPYNIMFGYTSSHMGIKESFQSPYLDVVNPATDVTVTGGNGDGQADPGETVSLLVKLTNPWRASGKAVGGVTATLTTTTPGVTINTNTSTYGAIAPQGTATGTAFNVTVGAGVPCGAAIDFTLTTVSSLGSTATTFRLRTGGASGTDPVITYTNVVAGGLAIPDDRARAAFTQATIPDDFEIADLNFRVDSLTHTFTGDVTVALRSPGAIGTDIISLIGGLISGGGAGDNMTNMVIDDQVAVSAANDMVQAPNSAAPYTKSWLPVFNAPWSALAGFGPPDAIGSLSRYNGTSTKGTWSVMVSDQFAGDAGTLGSWSLIVTPRRFVCAAPPGAAAKYRDFNADGKSDVTWKNSGSGATSLWLMNGTTYSSYLTVVDAPTWSVTQTGDLSGDGKTDLVWRSASGSTAVWLQNGLTTTSSAVIYTDPNWTVARVADVSGDGKGDLIWRSASGQTAAWLMNGLTTTSSALLVSDPNWRVVHAGDFNGDAKSDLVWRNTSTGATAIWLMDGLASSSSAVIFTSASWAVTHVGDFNGDGKDDLVWRNNGTGETAIWLMNGLTPTSAAVIFTSTAWVVTHVGDLDGNGKDDLVWRNASLGQTAAWLMNGTAPVTSAVLYTDVNWAVTHVQDTSGDGKSDLLWRNSATGATAVWVMNGPTLGTSALLLTDPSWLVAPEDGL